MYHVYLFESSTQSIANSTDLDNLIALTKSYYYDFIIRRSTIGSENVLTDEIVYRGGDGVKPYEYTIEIDCAPGMTRPDDLLPYVLKGTDIVLGEPDSRFFGCWTWAIPKDQREAFEKNRDTIKARLTDLYDSGRARYVSW